MSNMTSQTDAVGNTTNYTYDDFKRLTKITYPAATVGATRLEENLTYDLNSNVKTKIDTAGRTTGYDYDTSNRLTKITDALTNITQFEYSARSQMTKVTDALSQQYQFTYDPLGHVLSQTRAGTTMGFVYDAVGNRTQKTDYKGQVTDYAYDNLNRLTTITYNGMPSTQATYSYDDLSRLVSAVNGAGTVGFTYDNRNRFKTETDVFGHIVEYGYDANGNRTQLKLDGNVQTGYAYDVSNRLTTLTDEASQNFAFSYDNANKLTSRVMPNGITTTSDYDGMSRLTRLKDVNTTATLFDLQYAYNAANQISQITDLTETRNFGYDNVDRLTSQTGSIFGNESYSFDAVGNRTASHRSATYGYQPFNRLTSTATATYGYDANGATVSKSESGTNWTYTWDFENRMVSAGNGLSQANYVYDALGRRVSRSSGAQTTNFSYDGQDVLMDNDSVSGVTKYQNGFGIDNKLKQTAGSIASYFLADHLGSTNALTDASGIVTASNSYDSFGNATNTSFSSRYQFTGRELDSFSGLQFNRARWYDPAIGRFISEDPVGFEGRSINLFAYVKNIPLRSTDPYGLADNDSNFWFGDGGLLTEQTFSEFFSATERSKRRCKSTWYQRFKNDFYTTNAALPGIAAPSIFPGVGLGLVTSRATASAMNSMTVFQWAQEGFQGARVGAATYSVSETALTVAASTAVNAILVSASYEGGVAIGSGINATFGFSDYCPCEN
jgi:RHS repeat-associated protein